MTLIQVVLCRLQVHVPLTRGAHRYCGRCGKRLGASA